MSRRTMPEESMGGDDESNERIDKYLGHLGNTLGFGIYGLVWLVIGAELILSPIFLISQAKQFGIEVGMPWNSWMFWLLGALSVAMTGTQYTLTKDGIDPKSLGYRMAFGFAVVDTANDGAGLLSILEGSIKSPDSTNLILGMFPRWDSGNWQHSMMKWTAYILVCAACFYHERYLRIMLSRKSWDVSQDENSYVVNYLKWKHRAGEHFNRFVEFCMKATPIICFGFDLVLMPFAETKDEGILPLYISLPVALIIMFLTMLSWQKYKNLKESGYRLRDLHIRYTVVLLFGLVLTCVDSFFDLMGFNLIFFGQYTPIPVGLNLPMFTTIMMVMLLCTGFEIINSDIYMKLVTKKKSAGSSMGFDDPMGGSGFGSSDFGSGSTHFDSSDKPDLY